MLFQWHKLEQEKAGILLFAPHIRETTNLINCNQELQICKTTEITVASVMLLSFILGVLAFVSVTGKPLIEALAMLCHTD
jgi:hypothetical protein